MTVRSSTISQIECFVAASDVATSINYRAILKQVVQSQSNYNKLGRIILRKSAIYAYMINNKHLFIYSNNAYVITLTFLLLSKLKYLIRYSI